VNGLEQVCAEEQRITGLENLAHTAEKVQAGGAIEVADIAAEEENHEMLALGAAGCDFAEAVEIFAFEADDADAVDVAELAAKNSERGGRDFNWMIPGGLPAGEGFEKQACFAAGAAAEFGNDDRARKLVHDFPCVELKQAFFGSRKAIFRESADYLEKRGADRIV
jgi:hypothetical protein